MAEERKRNPAVDSIAAGDWLYKHDNILFGPVSADFLITRISAGEVNETTLVSKDEKTWFKLGDVTMFQPHISKQQEKAAKQRAEKEREKTEKRRRMAKAANAATVAVLCLIIAGAGGYVAWRFPVAETVSGLFEKKQNQDSDEFEPTLTHPPLVWVRSGGKMKVVSEPAKKEDGKKKYKKSGKKRAAHAKKKLPAHAAKLAAAGKEESKQQAGSVGQPGRKATEVASAQPVLPQAGGDSEIGEDDNGGGIEPLSEEEIYAVVNSKLPALFNCFRREAMKNPDLRGEILVEFAIKNSGKVGMVKIHHIRFEKGSLYDCIKAELKKWEFRPYPGERKLVRYPFIIGE